MKKVGVISDTHSLLRPEVIEALRGSDFIIHAGDIGKQHIIDTLSDIAPVTAVRGNIDKGEFGAQYAKDQVLKVEETYIYILHIIQDLNLDPVAAGFQVVVTGHTHKPLIEHKEGVLYLNPGSAGPKRFSLPTTIATLTIEGSQASVNLIEFSV